MGAIGSVYCCLVQGANGYFGWSRSRGMVQITTYGGSQSRWSIRVLAACHYHLLRNRPAKDELAKPYEESEDLHCTARLA